MPGNRMEERASQKFIKKTDDSIKGKALEKMRGKCKECGKKKCECEE